MEFNATFIVTAISFILFTITMNKIFYSPLEKIMDERQRFINDVKNETEMSKNLTGEILTEREFKLNKSAEDSKKLISEKVNNANEHSKDMTTRAKEKSQEEINSAKSSLSLDADQSAKELKTKVKDIAEVISSKVLGMDVKIEHADNEIINRILN